LVEYDPITDAPLAFPLGVSLEAPFANDADPNDISYVPLKKLVSFNLLDPALASATITAAGATVTYLKLAALLRKACIDRAAAQGIS